MMTLSLGQRQVVYQAKRLTHIHKQEIKASLLSTRLDLVGAIHGGNYRPHATCPKCYRQLTPLEIIAGFRDDVTDYTTACTSCNHRFAPKLSYNNSYSSVELPFFCATQVLDQLKGLQDLPPEVIQKNHPAIYHSVRVHHGNFRVAFEKIGIQYQFETVTNWKEKVRDFLGKLPDTVIAEVVDLPVRAIRKLRNELEIDVFRHRNLASE